MTRRMRCGSVLLAGALMMGAMADAAAQQSQPGQQQDNRGAKPRFAPLDLAVTYTPERAKIAPSNCGCFWLNGGSADAAATLYKGLGIAANLTGEHASNITPGVNLSKVAFMAGPRYTYNTSRWTDRAATQKHASYVFGEWLFGEAHAFDSVFPTGGALKTSASSFSMQLGGGANIALAKGFGLRLVEVDYVRTSFPNNGSNSQNDLRLAFGVSYRWNKR